MRDGFFGADEPRAELAAGRTHFQIADHRIAERNTAGDENRHIMDMRQDLLRENAGRHRADMPAGFRALDDQRIGAR